MEVLYLISLMCYYKSQNHYIYVHGCVQDIMQPDEELCFY